MSRPDNHSEMTSLVFCLIAVVLVGVGLAILVKRRYEYSTKLIEIQRESIFVQAELADMRSKHDSKAQRLLVSEARASQQLIDQKNYSTARQHDLERRTDLTSRRAVLTEALEKLEKEFTTCVNENRLKAREEAIGQKLESLTILSGRKYLQVTIVRVTDVGLEIRHTDGMARIAARDLDESMEQRFQWAVARR